MSLAEKNRCLGVVSLLLLFRAGAESLDVDVTLVAKIPQDMMAMPTSFARELKNSLPIDIREVPANPVTSLHWATISRQRHAP